MSFKNFKSGVSLRQLSSFHVTMYIALPQKFSWPAIWNTDWKLIAAVRTTWFAYQLQVLGSSLFGTKCYTRDFNYGVRYSGRGGGTFYFLFLLLVLYLCLEAYRAQYAVAQLVELLRYKPEDSRVRYPMMLLEFFIDINLLAALWS